MVVGKAGDTSKTQTIDSASVPLAISKALDSTKEYKNGENKFIRTADKKTISYKEQAADGIIAT